MAVCPVFFVIDAQKKPRNGKIVILSYKKNADILKPHSRMTKILGVRGYGLS